MGVGKGEAHHMRMLRQERVNRAAKLADPLPMNDPEFEDVLFPAERDVIQHDLLHVLRAEPMQVQNTIDGQRKRLRARFFSGRLVLVHTPTLASAAGDCKEL